MDVDDVTATPISRVEGPGASTSEAKSSEAGAAAADYDPAFLQTVLRNLPGVDPQNEEVLKAIESLTGPKASEKEGGEDAGDQEKKDKSKE